MILPEDDLLIDYRTSCTKDEAAAKMLGWMRGFLRKQVINLTEHCSIPADELPFLHSLEGSLKENLNNQLHAAQRELNDVLLAGAADETIEEKLKAVSECNELIQKAGLYLSAIDDELTKGESSALRIDKDATETFGILLITLRSLDKWTREEYGISILDSPAIVNEPSKGAASTLRQDESRRDKTGVTQNTINNSHNHLTFNNYEITNIHSSTPSTEDTPESPPGIKIDIEKNQNQKKKPKMLQQEDAVLDAIKRHGYDPICLPKNPGKPGVKSEVRDLLSNHPLFQGKRIFDRTWENLRKVKQIADVE